MPIFMDRHDTLDTTPGAFAAAHQGELKVQSEYACNMLTYWFHEDRGTAFCLVEAPTAEAVQKMHREAHGLVPNEIIEVDPSAVAGFLGRVTSPKSAAIEPIREPGFRVIMFTDMADSAGITMALGDDAAFAVMKKHHEIIRHALLAHDGREVDRAGDGFLTCFASVSRAVIARLPFRVSSTATTVPRPDPSASWCASAWGPENPSPTEKRYSARPSISRPESVRTPSQARFSYPT